MKLIVGALAVVLLFGCSHKRQPLDNRDPCLDFGDPGSPGFNACLDRRAKALKALLEDGGENQRRIISDEKIDN
ncbi:MULTISPECIES: hypothetical protein [Pseudomonas]|uniref:hypothetical protein n=1 Tax=Pseudomonas TaxID=286 RepID=UPI00087B5FD9|nr:MULTISPECIES: hypothetical protein [Pseudomonas]UST66004.1 hypothetical protein NF673_09705 [Pseudomonas moraviensis]SDU02500.1 hypothetical protein SAMN04490196_0128 [Pseudomonas moraviensis]